VTVMALNVPETYPQCRDAFVLSPGISAFGFSLQNGQFGIQIDGLGLKIAIVACELGRSTCKGHHCTCGKHTGVIKKKCYKATCPER